MENKEIHVAHRKSIWVNFFQVVGVFIVIWMMIAYMPSEDTVPLGLLYAYIAVSMYPVIGYFYRVAKDLSGDPELEKIRHKRLSSVFWKEHDSETLQNVISGATSKIADGAERLMLSPELKETTLILCTDLRKAVLERIGYASDDLLLKILDLSLDEFQDFLEEVVSDPKEEELVLLITGSLAPILAIRSKIVKEQIRVEKQKLIVLSNQTQKTTDTAFRGERSRRTWKAFNEKPVVTEQDLEEAFERADKELEKIQAEKVPGERVSLKEIEESFNTPQFARKLLAFLRKTGQIRD